LALQRKSAPWISHDLLKLKENFLDLQFLLWDVEYGTIQKMEINTSEAPGPKLILSITFLTQAPVSCKLI
jgi:hypothetical protein